MTDIKADTIAERAARKVYERLRPFLAKRQIQRTQDAMIADVLAPLISAEIEPLLEVLRDELRALRQQVEDTIAVAQTEEDGDGFICAYHFKTGAIHRLLAAARKGEGHIEREPLPPGTHEAMEDFKREMEEEVIPKIENALYERRVLAEDARHRVMKPSDEYGFGVPYEPDAK